ILGIGKGILRVFSSDFPLLGVPPIPVICSMILTLDFPLLEAEVALIFTSGGVEQLKDSPVLFVSLLFSCVTLTDRDVEALFGHHGRMRVLYVGSRCSSNRVPCVGTQATYNAPLRRLTVASTIL
ncbi:hypothetical protein L208DRAFT_1265933, partial [Tricholoma matsutake]